MPCVAILALALYFPPAPLQDAGAKALAQEILTKGAALYDTRDAMSMVRTYADDAKVYWVNRDKETGKLKVDVKDGRPQIETLYREMFKDPDAKTTSRNTVEFAKRVSPDLLLIEGRFEPEVDKGAYSFVQERVKVGDKWLIQSLKVYVLFD